jgi:hypothetical protein
MKELSTQNLLSACWGARRITIGIEPPEELRRLSDTRALTCPGCGATVVLHAGAVRAHHFAHLPGAVCSLPQTEPETLEHREGKLLLARWLHARLPEAEVILEAHLAETGQRADVLAVLPGLGPSAQRIALEFQCANLAAKEWRRRHRLYREAGIKDLWLLGGSRLHREALALPPIPEVDPAARGAVALRTADLERALLWDGAPLLFLDAVGANLPAGTLARFRPDAEAQALHPTGRLSARPLLDLDFPWPLLDWSESTHPDAPAFRTAPRATPASTHPPAVASDGWLWEWLAQRFRVTPATLPAFFGMPIAGQEAFRCAPRVWQAALYYRFVHRRVGDGWWLAEVETWARAYLPMARPVPLHRLRGVLAEYQEMLAAAGFLSLPMGYGRVHARILADLTTLERPPDVEETLRLARYRRTLIREDAGPEAIKELAP